MTLSRLLIPAPHMDPSYRFLRQAHYTDSLAMCLRQGTSFMRSHKGQKAVCIGFWVQQFYLHIPFLSQGFLTDFLKIPAGFLGLGAAVRSFYMEPIRSQKGTPYGISSRIKTCKKSPGNPEGLPKKSAQVKQQPFEFA